MSRNEMVDKINRYRRELGLKDLDVNADHAQAPPDDAGLCQCEMCRKLALKIQRYREVVVKRKEAKWTGRL